LRKKNGINPDDTGVGTPNRGLDTIISRIPFERNIDGIGFIESYPRCGVPRPFEAVVLQFWFWSIMIKVELILPVLMSEWEDEQGNRDPVSTLQETGAD
jgi:hypothetical protein